jgi:hypothetical protein
MSRIPARFPPTRWDAGRRGFCMRGPYGSIFAPASLKLSSHSRISVVGKVERKWSMPVRVLLAFLDTRWHGADGELVKADVAVFRGNRS